MSSWFIRPRPNSLAEVRLLCIPFAGGSAATYRAWSALLPPTVEVCAVLLPGERARILDQPILKFDPLAEAITTAAQTLLDRPFALFGHSMGALLAFEVARRLRALGGKPPVHLFASGAHPPQSANRNPPIHELPDEEFKAELIRYNGTPKEVLEHKELMDLILPTVRADFSVVASYVYREETPLDCPITVFGGLADNISSEELKTWSVHTRGPFALRMLPGDHFFIHSAQRTVLEAVSRSLG